MGLGLCRSRSLLPARGTQLRALQYAQPNVESAPDGNPQSQRALQTYQALLKIVTITNGTSAQDKFLRARPEATSVPFIAWVAELEAAAPPGPAKQQLAAVCERLVVMRERLDDEGMEDLYARTMDRLTAHPPADRAALTVGVSQRDADDVALAVAGSSAGVAGSGGDAAVDVEGDAGGAAGRSGAAEALAVRRQEERVALLADPARYSVRLAEAVTGLPVVTRGFSPLLDLLVQAVPPAALTPEGVRQGHAQAQELGQDLQQRRRRSVSSIIGRTKLTPQEADRLLAGSAASRILDMLMTLPSAAERVALLPDCFTPPPPTSAPPHTSEHSGSDVMSFSDSRSSTSSSSSRASSAVSAPPASTSSSDGWQRSPASSDSAQRLPDDPSSASRSSSSNSSSRASSGLRDDAVRERDVGARSPTGSCGGDVDAAAEVRAGDSSSGSSGSSDVDVLWCTPSQLLNEIDSRLVSILGLSNGRGGGGGSGGSASGGTGGTPLQRLSGASGGAQLPMGVLGSGTDQLVGEALVGELRALRDRVAELWLERM